MFTFTFTIVVHTTARDSSDDLPSYPPDNHHSSDVNYWRKGKLHLSYDLQHFNTFTAVTSSSLAYIYTQIKTPFNIVLGHV